MNINEEDIDLDLVLGSTNYIPTSSNNSSGAGVNAKSRVDMGFAASDPLSELVWSPHNGLRLKSADSGLAEKKPFLMWNVGPSTKCLSTSQSVRSKGSGEKKAFEDNNLTIFHTGDKAASGRSPRNSHASNSVSKVKMENAGSKAAIWEEENDEEDNFCGPQHVEIAHTAENSKENMGQDGLADETHNCKVAINELFLSGTDINASGSSDMGLDTTKFSGAHVVSPLNFLPSQESDKEVLSTSEKVKRNKMPSPVRLLPNLVGENDLGQFSVKNDLVQSCGENDLGNTSAEEARGMDGLKRPLKTSLSAENSPTSSRIRLHTDKGKEKASSDDYIYGTSSHDDNDSHESVESRTSASLFAKGSKRQGCDKELIVQSKRMKKHGSYGSTSIFGSDSSFMNWISNMVKVSKKQESSSLALAVAGSSNFDGKYHHEKFMGNEEHNSAKLNRGFRNIFQSMYSRNTKVPHTRVKDENNFTEETKELMLADKTTTENLPLSFDGKNDNSGKQIVVSDKEVNLVVRPIKASTLGADFACTSYACQSDFLNQRVSNMLVCNREQGGASSSDTLFKHADNTSDGNPPTTSNMPEKINPLASLWITRLYTTAPKFEGCNPPITSDAHQISTDPLNDNIGKASTETQVYVHEKEICEFAANAKASVNLHSSGKLSSSPPSSQKLMASAFARRLDALRHITPSDARNFSTCKLTCFFCGRAGHDLRDCTKVSETELDELVKLRSLDEVHEFPCMCIRCFQLGHWAISCPLVVSSSRHCQSEQNTSFINNSTAKFLQLFSGTVNCSSHVSCEEDRKTVTTGLTAGSSGMPRFASLPSFATWNVKETGSKSRSASIAVQKSTSSNSENVLKGDKSSPFCSLVSAQNTVSQVEISRAIRKLRLSRSDVIRWINTNVSLSRLNGLFLRLRLGKLEASIGGTGYYVARITGVAREFIGRRSNKSILVDVGGMKSSVGSQYISNHDFLEDEIDAWCRRVIKTGGKIPSLDELNLRLEDKTSLCF